MGYLDQKGKHVIEGDRFMPSTRSACSGVHPTKQHDRYAAGKAVVV
jgi:hypothetical protein